MTPETKRQELPDLTGYNENRRNFPQEELAKYYGMQVAFSPDGKRILGSGADVAELDANLIAMGIDPSQVVFSFVDPPV